MFGEFKYVISKFYLYRELVSSLSKRGIPVYLVSGGFQSILVPVAEQLGLPVENIIANRIKFYYNGKIFTSI